MEYRYRDASEMKDSGVEWIGEIPKDWDCIKFARCTTLKQGLQISQSKRYYKPGEGKLIYITVKYVNSEKNKNDTEYILNADEGVICHKDDVLLARTGATGKVVTNIEGVFHNNFFKVIYDKSKLKKEYLVYYLEQQKVQKYLKLVAGTTTIPDLNHREFLNTPITLINIKEQEKIVNFLDKKTSQFDSIISKKEVLIEKLEEAKKSLISEVVTGKVKVVKTDDGYDLVKRSSDEMKDSGVEWLGEIPKDWENIKIKRLSRIGRGASPRPIDDPVYFDENGEYAWTRIADVSKSNKYLTETKQKMSERGSLLSVKLEINKLFLSIAGSVGKPCITGIKACIHDGFVYFPDLQEYLNDYLYYIFYGGQCYKGLGKLGTQLNLNRETVGDIRIGIPKDKEEVNYITSFLEQYLYQIDKLITSIELQIEKLKEAKQSLISEAVTGKIEILD